MHSAPVTMMHRDVEWIVVWKKPKPIPIQRTAVGIQRFETENCVPYAHNGDVLVSKMVLYLTKRS